MEKSNNVQKVVLDSKKVSPITKIKTIIGKLSKVQKIVIASVIAVLLIGTVIVVNDIITESPEEKAQRILIETQKEAEKLQTEIINAVDQVDTIQNATVNKVVTDAVKTATSTTPASTSATKTATTSNSSASTSTSSTPTDSSTSTSTAPATTSTSTSSSSSTPVVTATTPEPVKVDNTAAKAACDAKNKVAVELYQSKITSAYTKYTENMKTISNSAEQIAEFNRYNLENAGYLETYKQTVKDNNCSIYE